MLLERHRRLCVQCGTPIQTAPQPMLLLHMFRGCRWVAMDKGVCSTKELKVKTARLLEKKILEDYNFPNNKMLNGGYRPIEIRTAAHADLRNKFSEKISVLLLPQDAAELAEALGISANTLPKPNTDVKKKIRQMMGAGGTDAAADTKTRRKLYAQARQAALAAGRQPSDIFVSFTEGPSAQQKYPVRAGPLGGLYIRYKPRSETDDGERRLSSFMRPARFGWDAVVPTPAATTAAPGGGAHAAAPAASSGSTATRAPQASFSVVADGSAQNRGVGGGSVISATIAAAASSSSGSSSASAASRAAGSSSNARAAARPPPLPQPPALATAPASQPSHTDEAKDTVTRSGLYATALQAAGGRPIYVRFMEGPHTQHRYPVEQGGSGGLRIIPTEVPPTPGPLRSRTGKYLSSHQCWLARFEW